jgi:nitrite reductase/ring-hydroxylating ferredoxin subunit
MGSTPSWRRDFPTRWEDAKYISRRELAKFLTLGSALLVGANTLLAAIGRVRPRPSPQAAKIAGGSALPPGASLLFRYPTAEDPCIVVRRPDGSFVAYSQVCTHLSCAVVHVPAEDNLFCPCHLGAFSCAEGLPIAGPPTRRLPRILLEERDGELWAVGVAV